MCVCVCVCVCVFVFAACARASCVRSVIISLFACVSPRAVPQLAYQIVTRPPSLISHQLAGFIVGNPVFSCTLWKETANDIQMDLFYWHGMVPLSAYRNWKAKCGTNSNSDACNNLLNEYTNLIGQFDPDNIYTNFFTGAPLVCVSVVLVCACVLACAFVSVPVTVRDWGVN